jgi:tRNA(fMet)-specific endonuclease VapC
MNYLLDTNIIIFWLKGRFNISEKIVEVGLFNCYVSDVTVAELKFGVECSPPEFLQEKRTRIDNLLSRLQVVSFSVAIDYYAQEKARLRSAGEIIPDFDLLIGATAVSMGMTLVTNNTKHLSRINQLKIEDWTLPK